MNNHNNYNDKMTNQRETESINKDTRY